VQLRTAHAMCAAIGMQALAERARRELLAVGQTIGTRTVGTRDQLTPQEDQIARLARAGLSNAEIAAQLFLSAHTVEWHLRKVSPSCGSAPACNSSERCPTAQRRADGITGRSGVHCRSFPRRPARAALGRRGRLA
jgi:FixJ family two-component response regulator